MVCQDAERRKHTVPSSAPVVKWISRLASDQLLWVRVLPGAPPQRKCPLHKGHFLCGRGGLDSKAGGEAEAGSRKIAKQFMCDRVLLGANYFVPEQP